MARSLRDMQIRDAVRYVFDDVEIAALANMIDHHLSGHNIDAAPSLEMAALIRARKKIEQAKG